MRKYTEFIDINYMVKYACIQGVVTVLGAIEIKEDVGKCQHPMLARYVRVSDDPGYLHVRRYAVMQRTPGFLQYGDCLLHIMAYRRASADTGCLPVRVSSCPLLVTRHTPQPYLRGSSAALPIAPNTVATPFSTYIMLIKITGLL